MEREGRSGMGWGARLLVAVTLILVGAAAATWGLAHYQGAARLFGVVPTTEPRRLQPLPAEPSAAVPGDQAATFNPAVAQQIADLRSRVQQVENENEQVQGSAGRADALLIAFAARRAIERGVALGYLEPLLVDRFGPEHPQAVATIVTSSRSPVRLTELIAQYNDLEGELVGAPPDEGFWTGVKRGFSSLITVHRADRPSSRPQARYERGLTRLMSGEVDSALAETMRLPGAPRARDWILAARRYVAVHRALDEIESAALMGSSKTG